MKIRNFIIETASEMMVEDVSGKITYRGVGGNYVGQTLMGKGLYSTNRKREAKTYADRHPSGKVIKLRGAVPKNPLVFQNYMMWVRWLEKEGKRIGLDADFAMKPAWQIFDDKFGDVGVYVRSLGYDGVQIGTNRAGDSIDYVLYPEEGQDRVPVEKYVVESVEQTVLDASHELKNYGLTDRFWVAFNNSSYLDHNKKARAFAKDEEKVVYAGKVSEVLAPEILRHIKKNAHDTKVYISHLLDSHALYGVYEGEKTIFVRPGARARVLWHLLHEVKHAIDDKAGKTLLPDPDTGSREAFRAYKKHPSERRAEAFARSVIVKAASSSSKKLKESVSVTSRSPWTDMSEGYNVYSIEKDLSSITVEDVIEYWDDSDGGGDMEMYPEDGEKYDSDKHEFPSKDDAVEEAREVLAMFRDLPDPIPVWRAIKAKDVSSIDMEMGTSWSYNKQSAREFGKHNASNFLIEGKAPKSKVLWPATLALHFIYSRYPSTDSEEEIRVDALDVLDKRVLDIKNEKMLREIRDISEAVSITSWSSYGDDEMWVSVNGRKERWRWTTDDDRQEIVRRVNAARSAKQGTGILRKYAKPVEDGTVKVHPKTYGLSCDSCGTSLNPGTHRCPNCDDVVSESTLGAELISSDVKVKTFPKGSVFYHGTSSANAASIRKNGFDVKRSGQNAGANLGSGVYVTPEESEASYYWSTDDGEYLEDYVIKVVAKKTLKLLDLGDLGGRHPVVKKVISKLKADGVKGDVFEAFSRYVHDDLGLDGAWSNGKGRMDGGKQVVLYDPSVVTVIEDTVEKVKESSTMKASKTFALEDAFEGSLKNFVESKNSEDHRASARAFVDKFFDVLEKDPGRLVRVASFFYDGFLIGSEDVVKGTIPPLKIALNVSYVDDSTPENKLKLAFASHGGTFGKDRRDNVNAIHMRVSVPESVEPSSGSLSKASAKEKAAVLRQVGTYMSSKTFFHELIHHLDHSRRDDKSWRQTSGKPLDQYANSPEEVYAHLQEMIDSVERTINKSETDDFSKTIVERIFSDRRLFFKYALGGLSKQFSENMSDATRHKIMKKLGQIYVDKVVPVVKRFERESFESIAESKRSGRVVPGVVKVYHGTPRGDFGEFKDSEGGIFFTDDRQTAEGYTKHRGAWRSTSKTPLVREEEIRLGKALEIDAMGARNNNIPYPGHERKPTVFGNLPKDAISVRDAAKKAFADGYDTLVVKNVMDGADPTDKRRSTVYAVRSKSQIVTGKAKETVVSEARQADPKDIDVRDAETGTPISGFLYHGSREEDIEELEPRNPPYSGGLGKAVYLAEYDEAKNYAYKGYVYRVPVSFKKPFVLDPQPIDDGDGGPSHDLVYELKQKGISFNDWWEENESYAQYDHPFGAWDDVIEDGDLPDEFYEWVTKSKKGDPKKIRESVKFLQSYFEWNRSGKKNDMFPNLEEAEIKKQHGHHFDVVDDLWDAWPENNVPQVSADSILPGENVPPFWYTVNGEIHGVFTGGAMEDVASIVKDAGYDALFAWGLRGGDGGSFDHHEVLSFKPIKPDMIFHDRDFPNGKKIGEEHVKESSDGAEESATIPAGRTVLRTHMLNGRFTDCRIIPDVKRPCPTRGKLGETVVRNVDITGWSKNKVSDHLSDNLIPERDCNGFNEYDEDGDKRS